jgi:hypothetical protein
MTANEDPGVDAAPVRDNLRARGFEQLTVGFNNPRGETWRHPDTNELAQLMYCPGTRDRFLRLSWEDALGVR